MILFGSFSLQAKRPPSFLHEGGINFFSGFSQYTSTLGLGITYSPQVVFREFNRTQSLSMASYITIGKSVISKEYIPSTRLNPFDYEIPIYLQYNYGFGATNQKTGKKLGLYAGIGYAFSSLSFAPVDAYGIPGNFNYSYGPTFMFGIRDNSMWGANIYLIKASNSASVFGLRFLYNMRQR